MKSDFAQFYSRGMPRVIRTDNGKEFCGKDMLIWAHDEKVDLRLIEPGKPSQNAYIESFNGRLRDEQAIATWKKKRWPELKK